jgi:hypothetical protein
VERPVSHPAAHGGKPIDIYPDDLNSVAGKFATGQSNLDKIAGVLNTALQDAAGMAGNDSYGHKFGAKYDPAAKALFHTLSAAVRAIGQASTALVTTANNYLKADHHSSVKAPSGGPFQYPLPGVLTDVLYPDPDSAIGPGHSSVPQVIAKYWPNGHQDKLRSAADAYRTASTALRDLGRTLHQQVQSLTDNNSDESVEAMADFWAQIWQDGGKATKAPLSAAHQACDKLAAACEAFAHAIDEAHSGAEHKMAEAGVTLTLTTVAGVLLSPFTGGGSDAGAAALDSAEAGAILGGVELALNEALSNIGADMIADLETYLQAAADSVPEIETVDAETTEVSQVLERELSETEIREPAGVGGRGGGSSEPPSTGGGGEGPEGPSDDEPDSSGRGRQERGQAYEDHLQEQLGGNGSFRQGGREFDGSYTEDDGTETWYEAKSGKYWDLVNRNPKVMAKFKANLGDARRIATENGSGFQLISENPIPENIAEWLAKKGYTWKVIP